MQVHLKCEEERPLRHPKLQDLRDQQVIERLVGERVGEAAEVLFLRELLVQREFALLNAQIVDDLLE